MGACEEYAEVRIIHSMRQSSDHLPKERAERAECLRSCDWYVTREIQKRIDEAPPDVQSCFDPSLSSLDAIAARAKLRVQAKGAAAKVIKVSMRAARSIPKYDAWIPVKTNYWVGKHLHVEPYMPFLGDRDDDCELAFEVYEDMADDAGQELDLSDGELGPDGKFNIPKDDIERYNYYSLAKTRWREGCRKAILAVLDKFTKFDDSMWRVLGSALGVKETQRIRAIARVAEDRRHDQSVATANLKKLKEMKFAISDAEDNPQEEEMPLEENWSASANPLRAFCFTCHTFPCPQHANVDVEPVLPIEDINRIRREHLVQSKKAKICSKDCFLDESESRSVVLDEEWSAEEILLLREAVPIFGLDPCSLATVIGSRKCYEVNTKLHDPIEADIAQHEILKAAKEQRVEVIKRKQTIIKGKTAKDKLSAKSAVDKTDPASSTDQDFVPCYHNGPCTLESCTCIKKGMYCETTCGCNFGRYQELNREGNVVWVEPSPDSIKAGTARTCPNRHFGCSCETGHCSTQTCPCWDHNRACSPDFCDCDACILPNRISTAKRNCRNIPASIALHKKTYVGKSDVHGFGLFAAERFECGNLVGVYSGQLIDTRLADMIGRLYDATDRTYIFNVTESLVIDGGLLGSKAKFCNHTKPGDSENCASKLVRVRGDAYVALFTKRAVEPGEEFLFDYRFTGEVPSWAQDDENFCED